MLLMLLVVVGGSYEWCMLLMLLVVVGIAMSGACC